MFSYFVTVESKIFYTFTITGIYKFAQLEMPIGLGQMRWISTHMY